VTKKAIYPGMFDPVTFGHLDVVMRACRLFDDVTVAVACGFEKKPLFSLQERLDMVRLEVDALSKDGSIAPEVRVEVCSFEGLLVDFVRERGASAIIRGLRAVSDFEYELKMASANARLEPKVDTLFLMACERQHFTSSDLVREIASLHGDVSPFVSARVVKRLQDKLANKSSDSPTR